MLACVVGEGFRATAVWGKRRKKEKHNSTSSHFSVLPVGASATGEEAVGAGLIGATGLGETGAVPGVTGAVTGIEEVGASEWGAGTGEVAGSADQFEGGGGGRKQQHEVFEVTIDSCVFGAVMVEKRDSDDQSPSIVSLA